MGWSSNECPKGCQAGRNNYLGGGKWYCAASAQEAKVLGNMNMETGEETWYPGAGTTMYECTDNMNYTSWGCNKIPYAPQGVGEASIYRDNYDGTAGGDCSTLPEDPGPEPEPPVIDPVWQPEPWPTKYEACPEGCKHVVPGATSWGWGCAASKGGINADYEAKDPNAPVYQYHCSGSMVDGKAKWSCGYQPNGTGINVVDENDPSATCEPQYWGSGYDDEPEPTPDPDPEDPLPGPNVNECQSVCTLI